MPDALVGVASENITPETPYRLSGARQRSSQEQTFIDQFDRARSREPQGLDQVLHRIDVDSVFAGYDEYQIKAGCFNILQILRDRVFIATGKLQLVDDSLPMLVDVNQSVPIEFIGLRFVAKGSGRLILLVEDIDAFEERNSLLNWPI